MSVGGGWVFRVASTQQVGGGHVARCMVLAESLKRLGVDIQFVLDHGSRDFEGVIRSRGFPSISWERALQGQNRNLLLDGYHFSDGMICEAKASFGVIAGFWDFGLYANYLDLAIAPAMKKSVQAQGLGAALTDICAGLEFAIVDPQYSARSVAGRNGSVLVTFGRVDSKNATAVSLKALDIFCKRTGQELKITVALGAGAPHRKAIEEIVERQSGVNLVFDAHMLSCFELASCVIGGGGVSLLERMAYGLPSISVTLSENQKMQIHACASAGGTISAGSIDSLSADVLAGIYEALHFDAKRREEMSLKAKLAVDAKGADRCAERMISLSMNTRR